MSVYIEIKPVYIHLVVSGVVRTRSAVLRLESRTPDLELEEGYHAYRHSIVGLISCSSPADGYKPDKPRRLSVYAQQ